MSELKLNKTGNLHTELIENLVTAAMRATDAGLYNRTIAEQELGVAKRALRTELEKLIELIDEAQATCVALGQTADNFGAQTERLKEIIRKAEWGEWHGSNHEPFYECAYCGNKKDEGHHETCTFYQWEAANAPVIPFDLEAK